MIYILLLLLLLILLFSVQSSNDISLIGEKSYNQVNDISTSNIMSQHHQNLELNSVRILSDTTPLPTSKPSSYPSSQPSVQPTSQPSSHLSKTFINSVLT